MRRNKQLPDPWAKNPSSKESVSFYSKQGHLITENQDTVIVDSSLFIVCDGHGKHGKTVSKFVGGALHESCLVLFNDRDGDNIITTKDYDRCSKNLREIFLEVNEELRQEGFDVSMSGSTASLLFKNDNLIVVANCGDSQIFLCRQSVAI